MPHIWTSPFAFKWLMVLWCQNCATYSNLGWLWELPYQLTAIEQISKVSHQNIRLHIYARRLVESCGWLSIKQLVVYQTESMIHKTHKNKSPGYMVNRLNMEQSNRTRQGTNCGVRQDETFRSSSSLPRGSFRFRGSHDSNQIPATIRAIHCISTFKARLKHWLKRSISLE